MEPKDTSEPTSNLETADPAYDHFVVGELNELLKQEDLRQVALEKKAALAATLTLAVSAYCLDAAGGTRPIGMVSSIVGLWIMICVVGLLVSAYLSIGVSKSSAVKPLQLLGPAVRQQDHARRIEGYASHLGATLAAARQQGEAKARHVDRAQQWAIVGSISALAFLLLQIACPHTSKT